MSEVTGPDVPFWGNLRYRLWLLKKSLQWQKLPKFGDQKCIPTWRKSFIGHPSASSFLREDSKRVFQQTRLITTARRESQAPVWQSTAYETTNRRFGFAFPLAHHIGNRQS
jgi:hypothetical protein